MSSYHDTAYAKGPGLRASFSEALFDFGNVRDCVSRMQTSH